MTDDNSDAEVKEYNPDFIGSFERAEAAEDHFMSVFKPTSVEVMLQHDGTYYAELSFENFTSSAAAFDKLDEVIDMLEPATGFNDYDVFLSREPDGWIEAHVQVAFDPADE